VDCVTSHEEWNIHRYEIMGLSFYALGKEWRDDVGADVISP